MFGELLQISQYKCGIRKTYFKFFVKKKFPEVPGHYPNTGDIENFRLKL
jgi:hypothetical protein